jgi:hypothetical protein
VREGLDIGCKQGVRIRKKRVLLDRKRVLFWVTTKVGVAKEPMTQIYDNVRGDRVILVGGLPLLPRAGVVAVTTMISEGNRIEGEGTEKITEGGRPMMKEDAGRKGDVNGRMRRKWIYTPFLYEDLEE